MRGELRWDKFIKTIGNVSQQDQQVLLQLAQFGKDVNLLDFVPGGLRTSYAYIYDCLAGVICEDAGLIERDVVRTDRIASTVKNRSKYKLTNPGPSKRAPMLSRLLRAVSIVDDMGYCQGMNYVADMILEATVNCEKSSFCILLFALRNRHLSCLYETKLPILSLYMDVFQHQLEQRRPELAEKLIQEGFLAPYYAIEWFTTCFTLYVPLALTKAVFELWMAGFQNVLLRVGLAIMELLEDTLIKWSSEKLLKDFRSLVLTLKADDVVRVALLIELSSWDISHMPTARSSVGMAPSWFKVDSKVNVDYIENMKDVMPNPDHGISSCIPGEDVLLWLRTLYLEDAVGVRLQRCDEWVKKSNRHRKYKMFLANVNAALISPKEDLGTKDDDSGEIKDDEVRSQSTSSNSDSSVNTNDMRDTSFYCYQHPSLDETPGGGAAKSSKSILGETGVVVPYVFANICDRVVFWDYSYLSEDGHVLGVVAGGCECDGCQAVAKFKKAAHCVKGVFLWGTLNKLWMECVCCLSSTYDSTHENSESDYFRRNRWKKYLVANHLLFYGIHSGWHIRTIAFLLSVSGADANAQDLNLMTPLHAAVLKNRVDIIRLLMLCGGDKRIGGALSAYSARCKMLITPKHVAILMENVETLRHKADDAVEAGAFVAFSYLSPATIVLSNQSCSICNSLILTTLGSGKQTEESVQSASCTFCGLIFCKHCSRLPHWCLPFNRISAATLESNEKMSARKWYSSYYSSSSIVRNTQWSSMRPDDGHFKEHQPELLVVGAGETGLIDQAADIHSDYFGTCKDELMEANSSEKGGNAVSDDESLLCRQAMYDRGSACLETTADDGKLAGELDFAPRKRRSIWQRMFSSRKTASVETNKTDIVSHDQFSEKTYALDEELKTASKLCSLQDTLPNQLYMLPLVLLPEGYFGLNMLTCCVSNDATQNLVMFYSKQAALFNIPTLFPTGLSLLQDVGKHYCNCFGINVLSTIIQQCAPNCARRAQAQKELLEVLYFMLNNRIPSFLIYSRENADKFNKFAESFCERQEVLNERSLFVDKLSRILMQKSLLNEYYYHIVCDVIGLSFARFGFVPQEQCFSAEKPFINSWYCSACFSNITASRRSQYCSRCQNRFCQYHSLRRCSLLDYIIPQSGSWSGDIEILTSSLAQVISTLSIMLFNDLFFDEKAEDRERTQSGCNSLSLHVEGTVEVCQFLARTVMHIRNDVEKDTHRNDVKDPLSVLPEKLRKMEGSYTLSYVICNQLLGCCLQDSQLSFCEECVVELKESSAVINDLKNNFSQCSHSYWRANLNVENGDLDSCAPDVQSGNWINDESSTDLFLVSPPPLK